jgi:hypothetical protein
MTDSEAVSIQEVHEKLDMVYEDIEVDVLGVTWQTESEAVYQSALETSPLTVPVRQKHQSVPGQQT